MSDCEGEGCEACEDCGLCDTCGSASPWRCGHNDDEWEEIGEYTDAEAWVCVDCGTIMYEDEDVIHWRTPDDPICARCYSAEAGGVRPAK